MLKTQSLFALCKEEKNTHVYDVPTISSKDFCEWVVYEVA